MDEKTWKNHGWINHWEILGIVGLENGEAEKSEQKWKQFENKGAWNTRHGHSLHIGVATIERSPNMMTKHETQVEFEGELQHKLILIPSSLDKIRWGTNNI